MNVHNKLGLERLKKCILHKVGYLADVAFKRDPSNKFPNIICVSTIVLFLTNCKTFF